jgi:hypothetical protein
MMTGKPHKTNTTHSLKFDKNDNIISGKNA